MASKCLLAAMTLAAACGSPSTPATGTPDAPPQTVTPDAPPQIVTPDAPTTGDDVVVTPAGTADGDPTAQTLDASGGVVTEPKTGASVHFLAGAFAGTTGVTLQPVTDTLPGGVGDGVAVSMEADPTQTYLVSFPYGADEDPSGLGVAVQLADGSWLAFEPFVDTNAHTISGVVPAALPGAAGKLPQVSLERGKFVKLERTYMVPAKATVRIGQQVKNITPWARVREQDCPAIVCWGELCAPCAKTVVHDYPFTNSKAGFSRAWYVNDKQPGDSVVGTINPSAVSGADFSAPAQKPSPDTVQVRFTSTNTSTQDFAIFPLVPIKITADYSVKATFQAIGFPVCAYMDADLGDQFTATLTSLPHGGFTLDDISNQATIIMNDMQRSSLNGTATDDDHAWETFTLTGAMFYGQGTSTAVFVEGMSTSSTCTWTPPYGPATTVPSITKPDGFTFMFDETQFVDGTLTLPPIDIPNSSGIWSVTLTQK
jgi:hypothetical protein